MGPRWYYFDHFKRPLYNARARQNFDYGIAMPKCRPNNKLGQINVLANTTSRLPKLIRILRQYAYFNYNCGGITKTRSVFLVHY